ncbi:MAG: hypothetical protein COB02_04130 [Candidatus Cloacimonadota bacterium]|nr:MAG: hypothetical protein COB02_04130 [Candidatus Cloacimonadota bacterium]
MFKVKLFVLNIICLLTLVSLNEAKFFKKEIKNVVDVCISGEDTYYLNQHGVVFVKKDGSFHSLELPDRLIQITSVKEVLYMLREDGSVWSYGDKKVSLIDGKLPSKQILSAGNKLFILKNSGGLRSFKNGQVDDLIYDRNFEVMVTYGKNKLFFLDTYGRVWRYDMFSQHVSLIDSAPGSKSIVSSDRNLFLLKKDGTVFKYEAARFHALKATKGIDCIAAKGTYLFMINNEHQVLELNHMIDRLKVLKFEEKANFLKVVGAKLFVTSLNGSLFEYTPVNAYPVVQSRFNKLYEEDLFNVGRGFKKSGIKSHLR